MAKALLPSSEKTYPLKVANTGFLLDRLGEDCHPLQFLRELTQNGIEGILRTPERRGEIVWDVDWNSYELDETGVFKLAVIDTGEGMSGDEMLKYLNQLSSSQYEQSLTGNFGVGAKIAAATRNHLGLIYLSWKNGKGTMVHLWRDPETGQYGLRQFAQPDGGWAHSVEIDDTVKPRIIADHGTMVLLLGSSHAADTMTPPPGAPSPSRWISKYLNSRFFRFPDGIAVKAREGWKAPRTDTDRNVLRTLTGQADYLARHAATSGEVSLSSARALWWILKDEDAMSQNSGFIESSGHVAALYRNELYELAAGRSGMAKLQQFGVLFGHRQVVIYVEPLGQDGKAITTNTARTQLLLKNEPLPWTDWASEFRAAMPKAIQKLIEERAAATSESDHSQTIRERLKQIIDLYKITRYRPAADGTLAVDTEITTRGAEARTAGTAGAPGTLPRSAAKAGPAGGIYSVFLKADGASGERVRPDMFPKVDWISVKNGTREPGDFEDRAARYIPALNHLLINADFRAFTDMIDKWCRQLPPTPGTLETVTAAVHGWFQQALMETIIGVQALRTSREWSSEMLDRALSEEALTAAVMPRYHVYNSVKRELGSKLGKLQNSLVAAAEVER
jgi:hypothetical protein